MKYLIKQKQDFANKGSHYSSRYSLPTLSCPEWIQRLSLHTRVTHSLLLLLNLNCQLQASFTFHQSIPEYRGINFPDIPVGWNWIYPKAPMGKLRHRESEASQSHSECGKDLVAFQTHHERSSEMCTTAVPCRLHVFCRLVPGTRHSWCGMRQDLPAQGCP